MAGENILVGIVALALLPVIAWRIVRGLRDGSLPLYRTRLRRADSSSKFNALLALHVLAFFLILAIAGDLLLGLGLRSRL